MTIIITQTSSRTILYSRAILHRGNVGSEPQLPQIQCQLRDIKIDQKNLLRFNQCCGFISNHDIIPATYFHLLSFSGHLTLLTHAQFPFPLMGLVHRKNNIQYLQPVTRFAALDLKVELTDLQQTGSGFEFDIVTEVSDADTLCWRSVSTMLHRNAADGSSHSNDEPLIFPDIFDFQYQSPVEISADCGRRYASISGDINPIHLSRLSARLFGFKRAIAHGMWSKSWVLAQLGERVFQPAEFNAYFKRPLFIPGKVVLGHARSEALDWYCLKNAEFDEPHMFLSINR